MRRSMTKPTNWLVYSAKSHIILGICPVWSESSLSALRNLWSLATHWVHNEDDDQTAHLRRLIRLSAGCTFHFVGFVVLWLKHFWKITHLFSWFLLSKLVFFLRLSVGLCIWFNLWYGIQSQLQNTLLLITIRSHTCYSGNLQLSQQKPIQEVMIKKICNEMCLCCLTSVSGTDKVGIWW